MILEGPGVAEPWEQRHPLVGNVARARHGTPGSETSVSAISTSAAVAPLTCGFLYPAQLGWSGGHFPLEGEGVTLAVCSGRGGRGGRVAALLLQLATKRRKGCLAAPAPRAKGSQGTGAHRWKCVLVLANWRVFWPGSQLASCWGWGKVLSNLDQNRVAE